MIESYWLIIVGLVCYNLGWFLKSLKSRPEKPIYYNYQDINFDFHKGVKFEIDDFGNKILIFGWGANGIRWIYQSKVEYEDKTLPLKGPFNYSRSDVKFSCWQDIKESNPTLYEKYGPTTELKPKNTIEELNQKEIQEIEEYLIKRKAELEVEEVLA